MTWASDDLLSELDDNKEKGGRGASETAHRRGKLPGLAEAERLRFLLAPGRSQLAASLPFESCRPSPPSPPSHTMLVWWGGRLYYSDALVWLAAGGIAASAPLAWTAGVWPEECLSVAGLQVLDWCLSATVLHCIVGAWLRWSLLPGWAAGRPSLYVLRATSALVGSASLLWLVATLVPRAVLGVSALLSVSLSLSGACWSAALWLQLQECGLAAALPPSLRAALLHTPPLELLGRDAPLAQAVARALQLTGVLLVPEADRGAALQRPTAPRS